MLENTCRILNPIPLYWELQKHPKIWNEITLRTEGDSPHRELDDIWVRYAPSMDLAPEPHAAMWYPSVKHIPIVVEYCELMRQMFEMSTIGGVLITRIPAGKQCYGHIDEGWHAAFYQKYALTVTAAPGQHFWVEDKTLETMPGEIFTFDNSKMHGVKNDSPYERITLIVCLSKDGKYNAKPGEELCHSDGP
jgi:hypothetical protein